MTDRPIPFSAPMVKALLDGSKTQTRRVLTDSDYYGCTTGDCPHSKQVQCDQAMIEHVANDFRYAVGYYLWVREAYYQRGHWEPIEGALTKGGRQKWGFVPADDAIIFDEPENCRAGRKHSDPATIAWHKRLGRFMPRKYSRLTLIVTDVRVQRLQDISEEDALAEGRAPCESCGDCGWINSGPDGGWQCEAYLCGESDRDWYAHLWNSIHGPDAWEANPWVIAVTFTVHQSNIDNMKGAA